MDRNTYQNDDFARTLNDEALTIHGTDAMDGGRQPYGPPGFHGLFSNCVQRSLRLEGWCLVTIKESLV